MSALETYAKTALETKGTEHMHAIDSLRRYIRLTSEEDLIKYVNMITDQNILRTLIEAGLKGNVWTATVRRSDLLRREAWKAQPT
jgi:hypothetical protein